MPSPFIESVRNHMRARYYSKRTEQTYVYWILYYIRFHKKVHPQELDERAIVQFLEFLAVQRNVTPSTQKTALNALMYLYKRVLGRSSMELPAFSRARKERKLPVVLTRDEVRWLLDCLQGEQRLCAELMCGSGLRLMEVCRLRVKDLHTRAESRWSRCTEPFERLVNYFRSTLTGQWSEPNTSLQISAAFTRFSTKLLVPRK